MEAKPMAILLSKIFQPNHDATQHVKTRPSPILKTHPTESVQAVAPVEVRAIGQPTVIQRRVPLLQAIFSNNPGPGPLNAFPMEIPMLVADRVQPMKSPAPSQSGTTSPPNGIAAQAPEKYATPQTLRAKLAALPRELTQNPSADREVPDANLNGLRRLFTREVRQRIADAKYYPRIARRRGMEGQPVVAFTLSKGGGLMRADLARTSGYQLLDQAALEAVHRAAPYPEIPAELKTDTFQFKLPISFVLK
jgi:protein TonB